MRLARARPFSPRTALLAALAAALGLAGTPATASDIFSGQRVYETYCVACHGASGYPTVPSAPDFSRGQGLDLPDVMLIPILKRGKNLMPAYDRIIGEGEMLDVLAYIRTLRR